MHARVIFCRVGGLLETLLVVYILTKGKKSINAEKNENVMVLRAQWPLGTIAQFFHFVAEEKKKDDKKTKAFYDWATTGIPVKSLL